MARVTSKDVAREAGVSQTTVSFVLNARSDQSIPAETRDAVLAAASRLGYVPSAAARSLRSGRSNVVLCVLPDFPVAQAMEEFKITLSHVLGESGYACVFMHGDDTARPLAQLWQHVQPAVVLAFGALSSADVRSLRATGIALLDNVFESEFVRAAGLDQHDVGRMQALHLIERGHARIGFAAVEDPRERAFCAPRLEGVREVCRAHGLPAPAVATVRYREDGARAALHAWSAAAVTAIAAFNDLAALAVLAACRSGDIAVPGSMAIIGVDDILAASLTDPPLSTIAIDLDVPARTLAARILELAGSVTAPRVGAPQRPVWTLIARESTR
ncbi:LacI family DNA-binding transcriptional regulator [Nocardia jejuensis]|uniref:LacI family DNA-binding transcriptional regulator n=1 Tax=Nocardia jejuensis TaxID=328049 RepID=UPI0008340FF6|nr:LacI family DNA-binding transcriptional regulator [Nocardia jejuensis]